MRREALDSARSERKKYNQISSRWEGERRKECTTYERTEERPGMLKREDTKAKGREPREDLYDRGKKKDKKWG